MPILAINVTTSMHEAIYRHAKIQSKLRRHRITMSDVAVDALRRAGFENEDILAALEAGKPVDIDVRTRSGVGERSHIERVRKYLASYGCASERQIYRNLHLTPYETRRAIVAILKEDPMVAQLKPFDRPLKVHWIGTCKCKTQLVAHYYMKEMG